MKMLVNCWKVNWFVFCIMLCPQTFNSKSNICKFPVSTHLELCFRLLWFFMSCQLVAVMEDRLIYKCPGKVFKCSAVFIRPLTSWNENLKFLNHWEDCLFVFDIIWFSINLNAAKFQFLKSSLLKFIKKNSEQTDCCHFDSNNLEEVGRDSAKESCSLRI